jgi:regulatory protein
MIDFDGYLNRTLKFLGFRPRSEKEVRDYLIKKQAPDELREKLITYLIELRFLNDVEFTRWWVEQRTQGQPRSHRVIKMELKQKGIAQDIIEQVLQGTEEPVQDDLESARKLVRKKLPRYQMLEKQELYQKLGGFLGRKGFDWETIKRAIDMELTQE